MNILVKRQKTQNDTTIGSLYIDGVFNCYTLEDAVRTVKIKCETAIPAGTYKLKTSLSNRFKKELPILLDVPEFVGVRIHSGNSSHDTEGCILVGTAVAKDNQSILNSRTAFSKLMPIITTVLKSGEEITITIENTK